MKKKLSLRAIQRASSGLRRGIPVAMNDPGPDNYPFGFSSSLAAMKSTVIGASMTTFLKEFKTALATAGKPLFVFTVNRPPYPIRKNRPRKRRKK